MIIDYLGNWQRFIPEIAGLLYAQWSDLYQGSGVSEAALEAALYARTDPDRLPLTFILIKDGQWLGVGSLKPAEDGTKAGLSPWIGGLYIKAANRGQGLGRQLLQALEAKAQTLGVEQLYLSADDAIDFYHAQGWCELERLTSCGARQVALMSKRLSPIN